MIRGVKFLNDVDGGIFFLLITILLDDAYILMDQIHSSSVSILLPHWLTRCLHVILMGF